MTKKQKRLKRRNARQQAADRVVARASYWCTSIRTMQAWIRSGVPVDCVNSMFEWYEEHWEHQAKMTPSFRRRIEFLLASWERKNGRGYYSDGDWFQLERKRIETITGCDPQKKVAALASLDAQIALCRRPARSFPSVE